MLKIFFRRPSEGNGQGFISKKRLAIEIKPLSLRQEYVVDPL
ncbi:MULTISPECIES: hypothetical protein [Neisseria]|nr:MULTISPECIES: hypothetical protein [Neisseria]